MQFIRIDSDKVHEMVGDWDAYARGVQRQTHYSVPNARFAAHNPVFRKACELAKVEPTQRQASKWRNRRGRAYSFRGPALRAIAIEKAS